MSTSALLITTLFMILKHALRALIGVQVPMSQRCISKVSMTPLRQGVHVFTDLPELCRLQGARRLLSSLLLKNQRDREGGVRLPSSESYAAAFTCMMPIEVP